MDNLCIFTSSTAARVPLKDTPVARALQARTTALNLKRPRIPVVPQSELLLSCLPQVRNTLIKLCVTLRNVGDARAYFLNLFSRRALGKLRIRKLRLKLCCFSRQLVLFFSEPLALLLEI